MVRDGNTLRLRARLGFVLGKHDWARLRDTPETGAIFLGFPIRVKVRGLMKSAAPHT